MLEILEGLMINCWCMFVFRPIKIDFSQIKKGEGEKQESTSSSSEKSTDPKPPTSAGNIDLLDIGDLPHIPAAVSPQKQ